MTSPYRWLLIALLAGATFLGGNLARQHLLRVARQRLVQKYIDRITAYSERDAARLVRQLAHSPDEWLEVLVVATCDDRDEVSTIAQRQLSDIVHAWSLRPTAESSPRCAALASLLAYHAPSLSPDRRPFVHSLSRRLIAWPIDSRRIDSSSYIAHCHLILDLPVAGEPQLRIAAAPEPPPQPVLEPPPPLPALLQFDAAEPTPLGLFPQPLPVSASLRDE